MLKTVHTVKKGEQTGSGGERCDERREEETPGSERLYF